MRRQQAMEPIGHMLLVAGEYCRSCTKLAIFKGGTKVGSES